MTTSHSNKVKIKNSAIKSIQYVDNSFIITDGQPSSPPPSINQSGDTWTIDIECGRKGNSSVASQFVAISGGVGHVFSPSDNNDSTPDKLNFFFGIRVGFQLGDEMFYVDLYVGQGHQAWLRNNWWIGGRFIALHSETFPLPGRTDAVLRFAVINIPAIPSGGIKEVYSIAGGYSDFSLTPWIQMGTAREQPNWLKGVPDSKLICDINLPGTHDSAAINRRIKTFYACHNHTLSEQLLYGVRLLDIRLRVLKEGGDFSFMTCHGDLGSIVGSNEYQSFPSVLDECHKFLIDNPSEFIAMSLQVDDWNNIDKKVFGGKVYMQLIRLLNQYPILISLKMPTLGDARSKIYLLNQINANISLGVPVNKEDNTSGWTPKKRYSSSERYPPREFDLYLQDKYTNLGALLGESAEHEKYRLFIDAIENASSGKMVLNFASGLKQIIISVYIMDRVLEYFGNKNAIDRPTQLGWMLFDYIFTSYSTNTYGDINVLQLIISSNFGYAGYEKKFMLGMKKKDDI